MKTQSFSEKPGLENAFTAALEYAAIAIGVECPTAAGCSNTLAPTSLIQNVLIRDNSIATVSGFGILVANTFTSSIFGNTVSDSSSTVLQSSYGGPNLAVGSMHTTRSSDLNIGINSFTRAATNN